MVHLYITLFVFQVTSFVLWIGKAMIAVGAGAGLYFYLDKYPIPNVTYIATPLTFSIIGSYIIASIFFGVYSVAVDTLFLCFRKSSVLLVLIVFLLSECSLLFVLCFS